MISSIFIAKYNNFMQSYDYCKCQVFVILILFTQYLFFQEMQVTIHMWPHLLIIEMMKVLLGQAGVILLSQGNKIFNASEFLLTHIHVLKPQGSFDDVAQVICLHQFHSVTIKYFGYIITLWPVSPTYHLS